MTDEERDVALALSVLQWFDPDLCADLIGAEGAGVVRSLLRRGMLLSVVDPRTGTMRFHDLFRELMEIELGSRDPEQRLRLHRRAAVLWRARGDLLSAYHHLSVIGETPKAHELLVGPAFELVDRGDLRRPARVRPPAADAGARRQRQPGPRPGDGRHVLRRHVRGAPLVRAGGRRSSTADRGRGADDDHAAGAAAQRHRVRDRPAGGRPRRGDRGHRDATASWWRGSPPPTSPSGGSRSSRRG